MARALGAVAAATALAWTLYAPAQWRSFFQAPAGAVAGARMARGTIPRLAVEAPARDAAGASRKAPPEAPRSRVTPARDAELASALASARETLALKPKGAGAKKVRNRGRSSRRADKGSATGRSPTFQHEREDGWFTAGGSSGSADQFAALPGAIALGLASMVSGRARKTPRKRKPSAERTLDSAALAAIRSEMAATADATSARAAKALRSALQRSKKEASGTAASAEDAAEAAEAAEEAAEAAVQEAADAAAEEAAFSAEAAEEEAAENEAAEQVTRKLSRDGTLTLTRGEERELAKQIEAGRAAQAALDNGSSFDKERDAQLATEGRKAKKFFIESNIPLVHCVAGKHYGGRQAKFGASMMTYDDLIQEGTLGLINALEKFDWRKGHKFSSLAWWHIRMRMQRANQNFGRTIRLPSFMHARISTIARAQEALRGYLSREPSLEEIATATGLRQEDVEFAVEKHHMRTVPEERITWGHHLTPMDLTEQTNAMRALEKENVRGEIDELLKDLNPLERQVIILRFGFDNGEPRTLQVIGDILELPRQRVQVIQAGGMEKMRHPNRLWRAKKLTQMMNDGSLL